MPNSGISPAGRISVLCGYELDVFTHRLNCDIEFNKIMVL
jgi:hypothetical protein